MNHVIPAIIPTSAEHLVRTVQAVAFAPRIQVDVVDGVFAGTPSWPTEGVGVMVDIQCIFERNEIMVDIMTLNQVAVATQWLAAGASEIVVHLEALASIDAIVALKTQYDFKLWVAGNDTLPIERYTVLADVIDGVQLMGIHEIGSQGQPFSDRVLENITTLTAALPQMPIMIDGSVNQATIANLAQAGASHFVVGSALVGQPDPRAAYDALRTLVQ